MKTKLAIFTVLAWLGMLATSLAVPTIVTQPKHQTNAIGSTATLCVVATGVEPLTYQWRIIGTGTNFTDLPGATNACLDFPDIQPWITTNRYRVQVCDVEGCVTSSVPVRVYVIVPPFISQQPSDQTIEVGDNYTNRVTVTNQVGILSYQWFFNGDPLPGQTLSNLTILNVQTTNAGSNYVVITNLAGSVPSDVAKLSVIVGVTFARVTGAPWDTDLGTCISGAAGDYNGDGYPDLFISRYRSGRSALYHNNGDGTFRSLTNSTFPFPVGDYLFGPCSDFDNDGRVDLFAFSGTSVPSSFYYNNGDGTFAQVPLATVSPWWQHAVDYDHDGLLDLYLTSGGTSFTNRLYRNLGGRSFQAVTRSEVGDILGVRSGSSAAWADYDDDGWEDVVMRDQQTTRCLLFRNTGTGQFVTVTNAAAVTAFAGGLVYNWGDYDNDGRVDLCATASGGQSTLFRNLGGTNFERATIGITIQGTYNGASWGDYNNDGFLDLFMTCGNSGRNSLFRNNGDGTFSVITTGPVVTDSDPHDRRAAGAADPRQDRRPGRSATDRSCRYKLEPQQQPAPAQPWRDLPRHERALAVHAVRNQHQPNDHGERSIAHRPVTLLLGNADAMIGGTQRAGEVGFPGPARLANRSNRIDAAWNHEWTRMNTNSEWALAASPGYFTPARRTSAPGGGGMCIGVGSERFPSSVGAPCHRHIASLRDWIFPTVSTL